MSFVIYNTDTKQSYNDAVGCIKVYGSERGAKITCSRKFKNDKYWQVMLYTEYLLWKALTAKKIKVRNLMSDTEIEIPEDTPWCCRPDSETFWST